MAPGERHRLRPGRARVSRDLGDRRGDVDRRVARPKLGSAHRPAGSRGAQGAHLGNLRAPVGGQHAGLVSLAV